MSMIEKKLYKAARKKVIEMIKEEDSNKYAKFPLDLSMGYSQWSFRIPGSEHPKRMPMNSEKQFFESLQKEGLVKPFAGGWVSK